MKSEIRQLYDEVRKMRRDIEEITGMLIPEVAPTKEEIKAIEEGRQEFARGEFEVWREGRKRANA